MPYIEIKTFKGELNAEQSQQLITRVTDAVTETTSEKLRDVTWVVISEINDGQWGVGGNALGLQDVKSLMQS